MSCVTPFLFILALRCTFVELLNFVTLICGTAVAGIEFAVDLPHDTVDLGDHLHCYIYNESSALVTSSSFCRCIEGGKVQFTAAVRYMITSASAMTLPSSSSHAFTSTSLRRSPTTSPITVTTDPVGT